MVTEYNIEYGFESTGSSSQLVVIVDNPNGRLTFDEYKVGDPYSTKPQDFKEQEPTEDAHHITVFVKETTASDNPTKLVFGGTKFYHKGSTPKHLYIYCAQFEKGRSKEKSRKRTATTVGSGTGGGMIQ